MVKKYSPFNHNEEYLMAIIRNMGNDTECLTPKALLKSLPLYCGKSISIQFEQPANFKRVLFVDVDSAGRITDSYSNTVITPEQLCSRVFAESSPSVSPSWDDFDSVEDIPLGQALSVPKACSIYDQGCSACE